MEKTIEIPFGAKDSELKGWEYTIPEGMEAEIKDGKIIVKQKGTEDERIRKRLVEYFNGYYDRFSSRNNVNVHWEGLEVKAVIAYLERQKEQRPFSQEDFDAAKHEALWGEQKPTPKFKVGDRIYDKRDSYNRNVIREVGKDYYINAFAQKMDMAYTDANFEFLEHLDNDTIDSKPAEWSEEDLETIESIIQELKIIKGNQTDEELIADYEDKIKWMQKLKSLRPSWKPSEEQLLALKEQTSWLSKQNPLHSLYHQLCEL